MDATTTGISTDVALVLQPMCQNWPMSDPWRVVRPFSSTFWELLLFISEEKGISPHRMVLRHKGKLLPPNRMKWTIRRMGLMDETILQVEPTLPGSWWWHTITEYASNYVSLVEKALDNAPKQRLSLEDLSSLVPPPPIPINKSLRIFLRTYPDKFQIHCCTTTGELVIRRVKKVIDLPEFSSMKVDLGEFEHYQPAPFDWNAYRDIDDKYLIETFESVEEMTERLEREAADRAAAERVQLGEKDVHNGNEQEEEQLPANEKEDDNFTAESISNENIESASQIGNEKSATELNLPDLPANLVVEPVDDVVIANVDS